MANNKLSFADFTPISSQEWENKISKDLKGASSTELGLKITEGQILPIAIHAKDNIPAGTIPGSLNFPNVIASPNPLRNENILQDLMGGANALIINEREMQGQQWNNLLDNVDLSFLDIVLDGKALFVEGFFNHLASTKQSPLSGENTGCSSAEEIELFQRYAQDYPAWRFFSCSIPGESLDGVNRVSAFLESANARLIVLDDIGKKEKGILSFSCRLQIGTDYLKTIMTIRAIRLVWALLLDAWNLNPQTPIYIHCESDKSDFDVNDEEKNMIRSTSMAASAVVAGANGLWLKPVNDGADRRDFYNRIARNNLHLFEQEGKLGWVGDPVAGAKYFEQGANIIAEQGWDLFRKG